ncbi:hypothetical protein EZS27_018165 [termite gut metagenome]|uniref:Uncharacterized protein n=1 Tax=termite gut metagenome TaxID=433724 RepID=A0A5J4RGZ3_9ZZZZ
MDYSQFFVLKEELSLVAVIVILFVADLLMCPDTYKKTVLTKAINTRTRNPA